MSKKLGINDVSAQEGGLGLAFRKEKSYPTPVDTPIPEVGPLGALKVVEPTPAQIKLLSRLIAHHYRPHHYPSDFALPGKMADMVAGGEFGALLTTDEREQLGGCLLWHWLDARTVLCFGHYLFGQPQRRRLRPWWRPPWSDWARARP